MLDLEPFERALYRIKSKNLGMFEQLEWFVWIVQNMNKLIDEIKYLRGENYPSVEDDPLEFKKIWDSSNSVSEAARRMGLPYQTTHSRACRYKQFLGLDLKRFRKINESH